MNRLRELREDHDLHLEQVAEMLDVHPTTISKYELGKRQLTPALIVKFCEIFGVTSDYLLGLSNVPTAKWSKMDRDLVAAYRAAPLKIQKVVRDLLELGDEAEAAGDVASVS